MSTSEEKPAESRRGVGSQATSLAAATGLSQVLLAVVYIFAARPSPAEFGLAVAAIALGTSAAGFLDFGTNSHWVREIARKGVTSQELGSRVSGKVMWSTILACGWTSCFALFLPESSLWMAGPVLIALVINQTLQVPLRGAARSHLVAVVILTDRLVVAITFFSLVLSGAVATQVLWLALVAGSAAASVASWCLARQLLRPTILIRPRLNPWRGSTYFGIASVANSAQTLDLSILAIVGGPTAAALYGAVNRWTQPMSLLASAFASASAPFIARSPDIILAWGHVRKGIWMPLAAILLALLVFAFSPFIVPVLLGDSYEDSVHVVRILALVSIPSIIAQPMIVALQASGRDRLVAAVMTSSVGIQLIGVLALGSAFGATGAAMASLVAQLLILVALTWGVWDEVRRAHGLRRR